MHWFSMTCLFCTESYESFSSVNSMLGFYALWPYYICDISHGRFAYASHYMSLFSTVCTSLLILLYMMLMQEVGLCWWWCRFLDFNWHDDRSVVYRYHGHVMERLASWAWHVVVHYWLDATDKETTPNMLSRLELKVNLIGILMNFPAIGFELKLAYEYCACC